MLCCRMWRREQYTPAFIANHNVNQCFVRCGEFANRADKPVFLQRVGNRKLQHGGLLVGGRRNGFEFRVVYRTGNRSRFRQRHDHGKFD